MEQPSEESMESASSMLKDALQTILRHLLAENLEALRESGELPDAEALKNLGKGIEPEEVRELIREELQSFREGVSEEIRSALEEADIPSAERISEIASREADAAALKTREDVTESMDQRFGAFADSEKILQQIEEKLAPLRAELDQVENQEDQLTEKMSFLFQGESFLEAVGAIINDRVPGEEAIAEIAAREAEKCRIEIPEGLVTADDVEARIQERLGTGAPDLEERIRGEVVALIEERVSALSGQDQILAQLEEKIAGMSPGVDAAEIENRIKEALSGNEFRSVVEGIVESKAGAAKPNLDELNEPMAAIASKTTEKILAREAEGLVRQIKIELGKVRNELKKSWEQTVALVKSPDMEKRIADIAGKTARNLVEESKSDGVSAEGLDQKIEEIAGRVAEEASQESLKGFLSELRSRVEEGIEGRLDEFIQSDKMRDAVTGIATSVVPLGGSGEGGGSVDPEAIKQIVSSEIMRRTEEAFQELVPKHVGKFLDEKLPPPEFFESLVSKTQVMQEIDKRLKAGSGSASGRAFAGGSPGGPGDSAIFTNMIGRLLGSDELKEMIDDKFRVINNYIKNELVPKAVAKELKKG